MDETLFSEEVICAQRLFRPGTQSLESSLRGDKSPADSQISRSTCSKKLISRSESLSSHPEFRAVSEVLEIKTSCSLTIDSDNENRWILTSTLHCSALVKLKAIKLRSWLILILKLRLRNYPATLKNPYWIVPVVQSWTFPLKPVKNQTRGPLLN